jgi:hypothetical protein
MTRLEAHKSRFDLAERRGELLRLEELTVEEVAMVNSTFFERVHRNPPEDLAGMYRIYVETLHEWGVMCPHPINERSYSVDGRWYDCSLCKAAVIHH